MKTLSPLPLRGNVEAVHVKVGGLGQLVNESDFRTSPARKRSVGPGIPPL
jgi:hypothetical protein